MVIRNLAVSLVSWLMITALVVVMTVIALEFNNVETIQKISKHRLDVVLTGSMEPSIAKGSLVIVRETAIEKLEKGDIITYRGTGSSKAFVTHRIYGVVKGLEATQAFVTKGDANLTEDSGVIKPAQVVGKVVLTIPFAGYIVQTVKSKIGYFLLVLIPGLIIIISEFAGVFEKLRGVRNEV